MTDFLERERMIRGDGSLDPWTLHDLRRTARTNFSRLRVDHDVAERLLNHKVTGVRGIYDMWAYLDEKKEALELWSAYVKQLM